MKLLVFALIVFAAGTNYCSAQQQYYDVTVGNGNGLRFWSDNNFKIHMGNSAEYRYGPVTDYSTKMNTDGTPGRGWTWGLAGQTPIAAIGMQGNMQIAGTFTSAGSVGQFYSPNNTGMYTDAWFNLKPNSGATAANTWNIYHTDGHSSLFSVAFGATLPSIQVGADRPTNFYVNGNVGIGTSSPNQKLEIAGNFLCNADNSAFGFDAQAAARFGVIKKNGYYPTIASDNSSPITFSQSNQTGIYTNIATATLTERMRIDVNGNVGIGTSAPDAMLAVSGQVHAQEVKVSITVPGPDYVFAKDYNLTSLEEIESYIDQNNHLPEVPSAKEMETNGVQLGEMNMLLLKKIEELTLYMIDLKKENDAVKERMKNMQSEINQLKK